MMNGFLRAFLRGIRSAGLKQATRSALAETRMSIAVQNVVLTLVSAITYGVFLGLFPLIASMFMSVERSLVAVFFTVGFAISIIRRVLTKKNT